jgi:hypothetical protein
MRIKVTVLMAPRLNPQISIHKPILDQRPQGDHPIPGFDFLAFTIIPRVERDRHLIDAHFAFQHFRGELRLKIKAFAVQGHILHHGPLKHLVAPSPYLSGYCYTGYWSQRSAAYWPPYSRTRSAACQPPKTVSHRPHRRCPLQSA